MPTPTTQQLGEWGEALVADWLMQQGWAVVTRRWHCRWGELDLVAQRSQPDPCLAFVEVKTRRTGSLDRMGQLAITPQKQQKLWRSAALFLAEGTVDAALPCRFDVALVAYAARSPATARHAQPLPTGGVLYLWDYLPSAFEMDG